MANPAFVAAACSGQSVAGAAVISALFFLLMLVAVANLVKTKFPLYIVLTASGLSAHPETSSECFCWHISLPDLVSVSRAFLV